MHREFSIIIERDEEGYYVATVHELRLPYASKITRYVDEACR